MKREGEGELWFELSHCSVTLEVTMLQYEELGLVDLSYLWRFIEP